MSETPHATTLPRIPQPLPSSRACWDISFEFKTRSHMFTPVIFPVKASSASNVSGILRCLKKRPYSCPNSMLPLLRNSWPSATPGELAACWPFTHSEAKPCCELQTAQMCTHWPSWAAPEACTKWVSPSTVKKTLCPFNTIWSSYALPVVLYENRMVLLSTWVGFTHRQMVTALVWKGVFGETSTWAVDERVGKSSPVSQPGKEEELTERKGEC